jgi:diguanylate cyclase (GGDEF)-like protein
MFGISLLLAQALLYFGCMTMLLRARRRFGIGLFVCALGVMHFLETYLAAVFFVKLPFGLISPGSTVLFAGKLMMFLLLYIKEDAETVRQPIYGLAVGNLLTIGLALLLRLHTPAVLPGDYQPDLHFLDQMGTLMIWGTCLLFIDIVALIMIYERLGRSMPRAIIPRCFIGAVLVLSFDQFAFFVGLHYISGVPWEALWGGLAAKIGAAALYSLLIGGYLQLFERRALAVGPQPLSDVFDKLTYRYRYEQLLQKSSIDALTGARNRGQYEVLAPLEFDRARVVGRPFSLLMIDVDRFKAINDNFGHAAGDEALRLVSNTLLANLRPPDKLFRYGGEEFIVLCHDLPHEAAMALAERLRVALPAAVKLDERSPVTISIGVASAPRDASDLETLMRAADENLYRAKQLGRDRVVGHD